MWKENEKKKQEKEWGKEWSYSKTKDLVKWTWWAKNSFFENIKTVEYLGCQDNNNITGTCCTYMNTVLILIVSGSKESLINFWDLMKANH